MATDPQQMSEPSAHVISVHVERVDDSIAVVGVDGEIDIKTEPDLDRALRETHADGATRIVLDLTGSPFVDSTLLVLLVEWRGRLDAVGGDLAVVASEPWIVNMFRVTKLDERLHLSADRADAVARLRA